MGTRSIGQRNRSRPALAVVVGATIALSAMLSGMGDVARADSIFGQSFFGTWANMGDARIEGRGGMGIAYRDSLNAITTCPTQLPDVQQVTAGLVMQVAYAESKDQFGKVRRYDLTIPGFGLVLPMGDRMAFGTGFRARRSTQWTVIRPREVELEPGTPEEVIEILEREGTLFDFPFELGAIVFKHLRFGGGLILRRGTVRQRYNVDLPEGTDPADLREDIYSGFAPEVALGLYDIGPLSVVGYYNAQYNANVKIRTRGVAREAFTETSRVDTMPMTYGVGARLKLWRGWSLGADYVFEEWSKYRGRETYAESLEDEWVMKAGIEREEQGTGRRRRTPWRVGAYYRKWNYSLGGDDPAAPNELFEWGVALGTSLPVPNPYAKSDIAISYSQTGTLADNGVQENTIRFIFSIMGGERWY